MITDLDAFGWIQSYRKDPLDPSDSGLAQRLLNRDTPAAIRQAYATQLGGILSHYPVSVAKANILVHLGLFALETGDCELSIDRFKEAAAQYQKVRDFHCLAAALWLLGMTQRKMDQHRLAFARWNESRDLMIDLHRESGRMKRVEWFIGEDQNYPGQKWYGEQIKNMTVDMLRSPHDMFEWTYTGPDAQRNALFPMPKNEPGSYVPPKPSVYQFKRTYDSSGSNLRPSAAQIRQKIEALLDSQAHDRVMDLLHDLEALNQGPPGREFYEIHAFSASVAGFLPALKREAIQHLITARCTSPLQSRSRMIVTWMLGLLLINEPGRRAEAILAMDASITCARRMEVAADRENNAALRQWYAWHAEAMEQMRAEYV